VVCCERAVGLRCGEVSFFFYAALRASQLAPDPHFELLSTEEDCRLLISQATSTHLTAQDRPQCEVSCMMTLLTQMC
jgi:hypothetical protein